MKRKVTNERNIITPEMKEDAKKVHGSMACGVCKMPREFQLHPQMCIEAIASLPGVWDEAPEWADCADVTFTDKKQNTKGAYTDIHPLPFRVARR